MKEKKTWGRELAVGVLVSFMAMIGIAFWDGDPVGRLALIQSLWMPVFGLVGGAFGLKTMKHIKQVPDDGYPRDIARPEGL